MDKTIVYCNSTNCEHQQSGRCWNTQISLSRETCLNFKAMPEPVKPKVEHLALAKWPTTEMVKYFKPKDIEGVEYKLYEGFRGTMVINKVSSSQGMFTLVEPIVQKNVSVYAVWNKIDKECFGFVTDAQVGWHFPDGQLVDLDQEGDYIEGLMWICTGERKYNHRASVKNLRALCIEVAKQLEVINCCNLGNDDETGDYQELDVILTSLADSEKPIDIDDFSDYLKPLL